jgi:hypothetical protein
MRNSNLFASSSVLAIALGVACAQKPASSTRQAVPVSVLAIQNAGGFCSVTDLNATPSTIPFTANDPGREIAGGSVATITWSINKGTIGHPWDLKVSTSSQSFDGCTTVPASAISVKCVSASVSGGGQVSADCYSRSYISLSSASSGLILASGDEGNASGHNYSVVVSYQLADSWRYIANTCPLKVSYTVSAR